MKTKALISFAVTAKLICVFVFAYANLWFSYEAAQQYCHFISFTISGKLKIIKNRTAVYTCILRHSAITLIKQLVLKLLPPSFTLKRQPKINVRRDLTMRKPTICICENKDADQLRGNVKLISTFVFATHIVHFLFFLNTKFQASSHLLCLYSLVCVGSIQKPHCWFSHEAAQS